MRRSGWMSLLVGLVATLVACGGGGDQQAKMAAEKEHATAGQQTQATKQAPQQGPVAVTVSLSTKNNSGLEGEAKLRRRGESFQVALLLQGLSPKGEYPAHIHEGTCQAGGGVATALAPVSSDGNKIGTSQSTVDATVLSPDTSYFLQAHLPNGTPAACGNVPAAAFDAER